jgi:hypothetical protein
VPRYPVAGTSPVVRAAAAAFRALNAEAMLAKVPAAVLSISGRVVTKDMDFSFGKLSDPRQATMAQTDSCSESPARAGSERNGHRFPLAAVVTIDSISLTSSRPRRARRCHQQSRTKRRTKR